MIRNYLRYYSNFSPKHLRFFNLFRINYSNGKNRRTWLSKSSLSFEFSDFKLEFFVSKSKFCALNNEISVSNFEVFLSKSEIILVCVAFDDLNSTSWVLKALRLKSYQLNDSFYSLLVVVKNVDPFLKPFFYKLHYFSLFFSNHFSIFAEWLNSLINSCDVGRNKILVRVESLHTNCLFENLNNSFRLFTVWSPDSGGVVRSYFQA